MLSSLFEFFCFLSFISLDLLVLKVQKLALQSIRRGSMRRKGGNFIYPMMLRG